MYHLSKCCHVAIRDVSFYRAASMPVVLATTEMFVCLSIHPFACQTHES